VIGIVASMMCMSVSTQFYQFLLSFGVLGGISSSLLFNPSVSAISHWFKERRGFATGVACTAGGLGGVAFPLTILYCSPRLGLGWSLRIIGFIDLVLGVMACILLRKNLPPKKGARNTVDFGALLTDRKFLTTTIAVFLIEFAVFIPYTYICSYALHAGLSTRTAYLLNVLLNAGAVPGRILPGYVADRFGTFNTMIITAGVCTLLIFGLWLPSGGNTAAVTAFSVLYGFWSGAAISLTPVCIGAICDVEDLGKRIGTAYCISSFGTLTGIPIAGTILEAESGEYDGLVIFAGAMYAVALLSFVIARGVAGGWTLRTVV
jgi:MFS family permease